MIKLKGYTSWAVGLSVANISKALLGNMANVQAVSTIAKVTDFPCWLSKPSFLFLKTKVSTLISVEGGKTLSRSLNDKIPKIWHLGSATTKFLLKLVVDWRQLPHFPAKMTLVGARDQFFSSLVFYTRQVYIGALRFLSYFYCCFSFWSDESFEIRALTFNYISTFICYNNPLQKLSPSAWTILP